MSALWSSSIGTAAEGRFHKHVPHDRLADPARLDLLRALVARFSVRTGSNAEQIVRSYLNANGEHVLPPNQLAIVTSHPEPGVVRCYCGSATVAWSDHVFAHAIPPTANKHNLNK